MVGHRHNKDMAEEGMVGHRHKEGTAGEVVAMEAGPSNEDSTRKAHRRSKAILAGTWRSLLVLEYWAELYWYVFD